MLCMLTLDDDVCILTGDEEIPNHSPYVETIYNGQNYTGQNLTHFTFTREHNGLFVRCVLIHETISEYEMADYTVTRQVVIQCEYNIS